MKKLYSLVLILVFCGFLSADRIVKWDAPTTNADGTPCTDLSHHVLAITKANEGSNGPPETFEYVTRVECLENCSASITEALRGLPEDVYKVWVAAVDKSGNQSAWSEPAEVIHETTPPAAPSNLRIEITITVTVTNT